MWSPNYPCWRPVCNPSTSLVSAGLFSISSWSSCNIARKIQFKYEIQHSLRQAYTLPSLHGLQVCTQSDHHRLSGVVRHKLCTYCMRKRCAVRRACVTGVSEVEAEGKSTKLRKRHASLEDKVMCAYRNQKGAHLIKIRKLERSLRIETYHRKQDRGLEFHRVPASVVLGSRWTNPTAREAYDKAVDVSCWKNGWTLRRLSMWTRVKRVVTNKVVRSVTKHLHSYNDSVSSHATLL